MTTLTVPFPKGATRQGSAAKDDDEGEAAGPPAKKARKGPGKFAEHELRLRQLCRQEGSHAGSPQLGLSMCRLHVHCMHRHAVRCSNVWGLLLHTGNAKGKAAQAEDEGDDEEPGIDKAPTFDDDEDEADKAPGGECAL
jgi:hypothetical protein